MDEAWYRVRLAVSGSPESDFRDAVPDMEEELAARGHLRNPHVWWDAGSARVILEIETPLPEGTLEEAFYALADDLSDTLTATVGVFDKADTEYLSVDPVA